MKEGYLLLKLRENFLYVNLIKLYNVSKGMSFYITKTKIKIENITIKFI